MFSLHFISCGSFLLLYSILRIIWVPHLSSKMVLCWNFCHCYWMSRCTILSQIGQFPESDMSVSRHNSPINHKFLTLSEIVFPILPDKNDQTCLALINSKWPQNVFLNFSRVENPNVFCSFWVKQHKHFRFAKIFGRCSTFRWSICYF